MTFGNFYKVNMQSESQKKYSYAELSKFFDPRTVCEECIPYANGEIKQIKNWLGGVRAQ